MKIINCTISYGKTKINYELIMMKRKSLQITVHPDQSVVVKAPLNLTPEAVYEKVKKRAHWIKRQITYFKRFEPRTPARQYVGGESHLYLGKKYRLKIELVDNNQIRLKNGYFFIETTKNQPHHIKNLMDSWYRKRAKIYFAKVFTACWENFHKGNLAKPSLKVRKMTKRWGSLSAKGQLTLNVNLIQAPKECIEYVVIHELCHLIHHNHGAEFYKLLDHTMPDWMKVKDKLEMALI